MEEEGERKDRKKRNLFYLFDVFQLILTVCPPVVPKPS